MSPGLYSAGSTATLAAAPTRAGYEFLDWATTSAGTPLGTNYTPPVGAGDITLYAQWAVAPNPPAPELPLVTTPVATTPVATTPPSTTVPPPVPNASGVLLSLQPGESVVTVNGNALVGGFGFMPGTLVHVWVFSEPTYLGALTVADDGTFVGSMYLEGIAPGTHTLQVNGTSSDGNVRSANHGVIVLANSDPSPPLPATGGGNAPQLVVAALAMVMLGALARRRAAAR